MLKEEAEHLFRGVGPRRICERPRKIATRPRMTGPVQLPLLEHAASACVALD
jgi:hypothetical protein